MEQRLISITTDEIQRDTEADQRQGMGPKGGKYSVPWCLQCISYLSISKIAEESLLTATQQTSVAAQGTQVL